MGLSHFAICRRIAFPNDVAVCDANWMTRFLYRKMGIKAYKSIEDALDSAGGTLSGVIVATPTPSHFAIAQKVMDRSIPCFIEKPLTLSSKRSLELMELAERRGVYAQVGFVLRYLPTFSRLRELVRSGELGVVKSYQASMNGNVITKPDNNNWRSDFSAGGGCLNEYGPHLIDLCRFIFGEVSAVENAVKGHVYSTRADDQIAFNWVHASGVPGDVKLDWCDGSKRKSVIQFTVEFEHAQVSGDNSALHFSFREQNPLSDEERRRIAALLIPPRVSYYLRGEEYSLQLEDFLGSSLRRNFRADHAFGIGNQALLADGWAVDQLIESISEMAGLR
jgi:predicted dehydrogenase